MKTLLLFIALSLFSTSLWATPPQTGCEILLQSSYGRMMQALVEKKLITGDELAEVVAKDYPTNAYRNRSKSPETLSIFQTLESGRRQKSTRENWPKIRAALEILARRGQEEAVKIDEASDKTSWVLNPKFHNALKFAVGDQLKFMFVPNQNKLIGWIAEFSQPDYAFADLATNGVGRDVSLKGLIIRRSRDGGLWHVGLDSSNRLVVVKPGNVEQFAMENVLNWNGDIFESPDGRLFLAFANDEGFSVFDITDRNQPKALARERGNYPNRPVFHATGSGEVYVAAAHSHATQVFKLTGDKFFQIGHTAGSDAFRREVILTSDRHGTIFLGEHVTDGKQYRVVKFVEGVAHSVYYDGKTTKISSSASFHWNSDGDLIFSYSAGAELHLHLVNLSDKDLSEKIFPVKSRFILPIAWHRFQNGYEVIAVSPLDSESVLLDAKDGTNVMTLAKGSGRWSSPQWTRLPNGQTYLAVDGNAQVLIYNLGVDNQ